jgi:hypothetical protein
MQLLLILPRVEPEEIKPPSECPYEGCDGTHFQFIQEVEKPLRLLCLLSRLRSLSRSARAS